MIERFNFYDIYGYFLPGIVLAALVGIPFWLTAGLTPPEQLASVALAAVLGYVIGHFLQRFGEAWLPWTWWGVPRKVRVPSNVMLDAKDPRLEPIKQRIAGKILVKFGLDVRVDLNPPHEIDPVRQEAFFLCRRELLNTGRAAYAEQFQGMYSMMDGFCCAFGAAAVFYAGIASALSFVFPRCVEGALIGLFALLAVVAKLPEHALTVWIERLVHLTVVFLLGLEAGWFFGPHPHLPRAAAAGAAACLVLAIKSARGYSFYAAAFAQTVYRDFLVEAPKKGGDKV